MTGTKYHSQGFRRTTSQKSKKDLLKYVLKYCFCVWCRLSRHNLCVSGSAACKIVGQATFSLFRALLKYLTFSPLLLTLKALKYFCINHGEHRVYFNLK